jgi:hypothetical protein
MVKTVNRVNGDNKRKAVRARMAGAISKPELPARFIPQLANQLRQLVRVRRRLAHFSHMDRNARNGTFQRSHFTDNL